MLSEDEERRIEALERECRRLSEALSAAIGDFNDERTRRKAVERELDQRTVGDIRLGPRRETPEEERERLRLMTAGVVAGLRVSPLSQTRHTTDSSDPRLGRGSDETPRPQNEVYLVLSEAERSKGFLRPVRDTYRHLTCGTTTTMGAAIAETYARDPWHYGSTYCVACAKHRPLAEFTWLTGESMDPGQWPSELLDSVIARRKELDGVAP